jgi:thioredoxin 2
VTVTSQIVRCETCGTKNRVPAVASGTPRCGKCKSSLPWIAEADDATFPEVVEQSSIPVVLDLWAPWCGPCHMVTPSLEKLARDKAGQIKLVKVNVDKAPATARRFDAMSIPLMLVLDKGTVVDRQLGAGPEHALRAWLESALTRTGASA